jgi:transposase
VGAADAAGIIPAKESTTMARKHYSIEFQDGACKLVSEQGYTQKKAAHELGVSVDTLQSWLKKRGLQTPIELVEPDYAASNDPKLLKARIHDLEKRLRRSETEKEILKKATAYFATQSL